MKSVEFIIFIMVFLGCGVKNNEPIKSEVEQSLNQPLKNITELKESVLYNGDIGAYNELDIAYLDHTFQEEFLLYAMIMANKYNYPQAYYDVFTCLTDIYLSDLNQLDEKTASLAIDYLLQANEKGHHQAKDIVEEYKIINNDNSKQQIERIFKE